MTLHSIKNRISSYEEAYDYKIIAKLPIIIIVNGRSFRKTTSLLQKPFSQSFLEAMCSTLLKLVSEIDGAVFGYCFNDEIVIISRNDQSVETEIWCDGRIQKISSISSSIATIEFNKYILANDINIIGDPVFTTKTFAVPNITEAINLLIGKQQKAVQTSIYNAVFYELLKKTNLSSVKEVLFNSSLEDKIQILIKNGIDYNKYSLAFRRGVGCYRVPKLIINNGEEILKNKLFVNLELPIFTDKKDFLNNIFVSGSDIFRK